MLIIILVKQDFMILMRVKEIRLKADYSSSVISNHRSIMRDLVNMEKMGSFM